MPSAATLAIRTPSRTRSPGPTPEGSGPQGGFTQAGVTLVEISIVLVIGGVLLGQDVIKAAEIRAQVSQLEKVPDQFQSIPR